MIKRLFPFVLACLASASSLAAEGFVGGKVCAACHADEHAAWTGSHHDLAMDHASATTVLGDFSDAEITVHGLTSRFFTRDGKYFVNTDGADGALHDFEVGFTFGVTPLQQYLVAFPDGRLQALPLAWDSRPADLGGQRWFHLYPEEVLKPGDELHWTGLQQNWNYQCADCHSTNLVRGYDTKADRFNTTWSDIDVACEACHGPGQRHIDWARSEDGLKGEDVNRGLTLLLNDRAGVQWPIDPATGIARREGPPAQGRELQVCAACHSRRGIIHEGMAATPVFLDHYMPALLSGDLYHDDGQQREEVYEWGSFLQSRMHAAGVSCSDCHEPHSLELRAPGAAVCAQCHAPAKFAVTAHHGHPANSTGADCLACHMPETTFMQVDPRRDHSLRIPRPDLSREFGTPNACSQCHADRDAEWLASGFRKLFPKAGKPFQSWTQAFRQARQGLPQAEVSLLAVMNNAQTPELARATAVLELRGYLSPLSGQAVTAALGDDSPLVRIAALRVLDAVPPANRFVLAGQLLDDPVRAVRIEAARSLAGTPREQLGVRERGALQRAFDEYVASQELLADRPESGLNLGNLYALSGDVERAEQHYRQALARDPGFAPAWLNLSDLYRGQGMEAAALQTLGKGLEQQPQDATLHHALGLARVRAGDLQGALPELAQAVALAPDNGRFAYVQGIGLNSAGRAAEAVEALSAAHARLPNDAELMFALATVERDRGKPEQAITWAKKMLERNPADQRARQLLASLEVDG